MSDTQWFAALNGQQQGPFRDELFRAMIARGEITVDTLVWTESMPAWVKAGEVPGLIPTALRARAGGGLPARLSTTLPVWPLLGRTILVVIGQILVIPSPWTTTSYYRWFVGHIRLPIEKQAAFAGKPGDIWYIFMLSALLGLGGLLHPLVPLLLLPLSVLFYVIIARWFFRSLVWDGQSEPLHFTGGYWGFLGWSAFMWITTFTIIGWAWVLTAMMRWACRHIEGSSKQLTFEGSGWGVLWRTFVFALSCIFIIPIPWTMRWYINWFTTQFFMGERA